MVEGASLLRKYTIFSYRGFESLSLRHLNYLQLTMNSKVKVAYVILALPFNQEFTYKVSDQHKSQIGSIVKVNFKKREQIGIVTNVNSVDESNLDFKLKEIITIYNLPLVDDKLLDFAKWVAKYNMTNYGNIVKMLLLNKNNVEYNIKCEEYKKFQNDTDALNKVELSDLQDQVVSEINKVGFLDFSAHLILGATGSGKTEVYLESTQKIVDDGSQALILLPEVLLATQLIERFRKRLKNCVIAEWNSSLTPKRKAVIWHGVLSGNIDVVVGARSALFLPFKNLKVIIIDEENDSSFKQEEGIVYNARDMAIMKAKIEKIPILLSTATPSAESYYNTILGKYKIHKLPNRYTGVSLPQVQVVDLKKVKKPHNEWISEALKNEIISCLEKGKLSMIFLNRRGYSPLTICNNCGEKFSCPNCQFFLVEHKKKNQMLCHYCGYMHEKIIKCNKCESDEKLVTLGPGIEKIEEEINNLFPNAKVVTLTSDTVSTFKKASQIIKDIENKEYDIILGTQMLAKGLNFPDLHLVGVIDADISFSGCDLRVLERTFQLLYQVAGRAGRQHEKGLVLIQTYFADNPLLNYIENWDYESFINDELKNRKDSFMPPFSKLIIIKGSGLNEQTLHSFMHYIAQKAPIDKQIEVLGPSPAPIYKIRNNFRYRIILRTAKKINIQSYIHNWFDKFITPASIKLKVDIDPYNFS